jgi:hypothetical protein
LQKIDRRRDDEEITDVEKSMGIGAAIGSLVGTPLAITTVMGPIMIAGPLAAAAGGAIAGGVFKEAGHLNPAHTSADRVDSRGLYAMANHFGINTHDAAHYEQRISKGAILIIVTSTPPRLDEAQQALKTTGPVSLQRFAFRHPEAT